MDEEVEKQLAIAQRYESAIAAMEPNIVKSDDGVVSLENFDAEAMDLDGDAVQQLMDSIESVNSSIASGEIAANDVSVSTPGMPAYV